MWNYWKYHKENVYFGIRKNPFVWDENGYYTGIKDGKFAEYEYIENVKFNTDLSNWDVSNVKFKGNAFRYCQIKYEYKPNFKK